MNPRQTEIWTVIRMVEWGASYFRQKRIDSPRLTIELMLAHVLGLKRFDLYMQFDRPLVETELEKLRGMVKRRAAYEPLQYILEEADFHGRTFKVRPGVLIPRPETELLVDEALRRTRSLRCLDVGTGSGCIAVTVALERPETEVVAIDVSEEALQIAQENAQNLGAERVEFRQIDFLSDESLGSLGSFDLIISNPPYVSGGEISELQIEIRDHEPHIAVSDGADGLTFYRRFAAVGTSMLRRDGEIFLELGYGMADAVGKMFEQAGFHVDIYTDFDRIERILRARKQSEVASPL
ncbi:MAG: peptide chain release factor N(5)-glutamine methyltransferase [Ignavibacteriae bacterium]|nr:peptide chain release factor N(5)-glutamine methyltransferase [Ignavibacteriota bacterium]MCB9214767.1 peptide chain release factor N(5)-glutamine methyltransferase [Ignavibacteria bacterium]